MDSGAVDAALKYFPQRIPIDDVIDPNKTDVALGGSF
jgi:hypothetical protein